MKKYRVLLLGENFEINFEGEIDNFGFYTTRVVKANSEEDAEEKAVQLIREDKNLVQMIVEKSTLEPKIYLEGIEIISWWKRIGGKGYSFYKMESE